MRQVFIICAVLAVFLAACGSPVPTASPVIQNQPASNQPVPTLGTATCVDARQATPNPDEQSLFPPIIAQDHSKGPENAVVTIIEYADFQCTGCAKMAPALASIQKKYPDEVRIIFRHFPLINIHDKATLSAQAAEAAALQGKFWEMHDLLYEKQADWIEKTPTDFQTWLVEQASALGLDTAKFETDLTSEVTAKIAQQGWEKGNEIGLPGTPLLIINGEILKPPYILENLESLVRLYALPARQYSTCPPFIIDTAKQYTATLKTSKGVIVIELFADKAPNTVNNFVFLAREGWYDNIPFHRVITDFMAQTGDPSGTGMGNPGYFIPDEIDSSLKFDRAGIVGMANSGAGTNGSQFFITYGPANHLNGGYTIFGQVISGMDVLAQITPRDPAQGGTLPEPDMLISITIEER